MKKTNYLKFVRFLTLFLWSMIILVGGAANINAQSSDTRTWNPDGCKDFVFTFTLNYDDNGGIKNLGLAIKPSYVEVSPEFIVSPTGTTPVFWQAIVDKQKAKPEIIIKGSINVIALPNKQGTGKDDMVVFGSFYYYCKDKFYISNRSSFDGTMFMFPGQIKIK
ncbi:MAG: hypothetical protein GY710_24680 [Desulfobacteraceae bacterium]|nr:hypothetical protein [Desulfobacteraceae bacterium]